MNENSHTLLGALRALVPRRIVTFSEALRLTELQASRFRELLDIRSDEVAEESITGLPRVTVTHELDLPVSGLAQWHNGRWIIALNGREPWVRQRFSLAHELFHVINHTTKERLHPSDGRRSAEERGEQLADYFAGCLLMPKRLVKRYVGQGKRSSELARRFGVSERAIEVRLAQLGLNHPLPRCVQPTNSFRRVVRPYHRTLREVAA